jgi:hypothetical protein
MNKQNAIRVALFQEKAETFTGWVAQCLDFDLVAQGQTVKEAQESFQRTFMGHVALSQHRRQNPFSGILAQRPTRKASSAIDLGKIRIAYSQLERPHTVPVV